MCKEYGVYNMQDMAEALNVKSKFVIQKIFKTEKENGEAEKFAIFIKRLIIAKEKYVDVMERLLIKDISDIVEWTRNGSRLEYTEEEKKNKGKLIEQNINNYAFADFLINSF